MGRVLGLDVGDHRIGIAMSDALGLTAQRLTVLERRGAAYDVEAVRRLVEQHGVDTIVVGLPLTMRGEQGIQAKKVTSFSNALKRLLSVPVELLDERLTTVQGERALLETNASRRKRKQVLDQVAAQLILQQFLDTHPRPSSPTGSL
jgi:putative Holliday junction resolvase